jgi:hypothetical protein
MKCDMATPNATQTQHGGKKLSSFNVGGRTVNPLADAFVGSSPTSPTRDQGRVVIRDWRDLIAHV